MSKDEYESLYDRLWTLKTIIDGAVIELADLADEIHDLVSDFESLTPDEDPA